MYSPVNDVTVLTFEILRGFFFKLKGSLTKQVLCTNKCSVGIYAVYLNPGRFNYLYFL